MDFLKRFIKNVLPVNQIIKFIIKQFLSSYLIYNENDLEEKPEDDTGLKNLINIQDLELNVSNINNKHLLHSPIKLLKGKFGLFKLDMNDDNKIIVTIEDVSLDLMPIFNFYKKYQETIFNMEEKKKQAMSEAEQENKKSSGNAQNQPNVNNNVQPNNNYMLNMANKLLTNLEINIRNIAMRLFTYEISEKIMDNPVFTFFIMSINIYKNENVIKGPALIDPNTRLPFENSFLDNLVIDFDKFCVKLNNNIKQKDLQDFAEIKNFCVKNGKNLTKEQQNKVLNFFLDYNTIFAINYKNGPCISIKLKTLPRIENYKINEQEKQKVVEDMNIEINIAEVESIITPKQLFNIQIMSQISNFIFTLNKNTPNKDEEQDNKKIVYKSKNQNKKKEKDREKIEKDSDSDSTNDNNSNKEEEKENTNFSLIFKNLDDKEKINEIDKEEEKEINDNNNDDKDKPQNNDKITNINMSLVQKVEKVEPIKKEEPKKTEVLNHELSKFNITMNCKRIVLVALENKDNESIPKLFSFLMEDEVISKKKDIKLNNKNQDIKPLDSIFGDENNSFENYYCYFEDNIILFKIENIKSVNASINISSVLAEYIQPIKEDENTINKNITNKSNSSSRIEMSVYESALEYQDGDGSDNEVFQSVLENTQLLIMENFSRFINKYISGDYKSTKFEILTITDIKYDMNEKMIEINEIFLNINYMIILLITKILSKVQYFMNMDGKPIYTIEEEFNDEENLNINLEKRINDTELQLFRNLKKKYDKNNLDDSESEGEDKDIFDQSIGYSEEEKQKKEGIKIKIKYISIKIHNIASDPQRFDSNIYYFNLFQEFVYPNLSKIEGAKLSQPVGQYFQDILSKDFLELVIIDMNMVYYNISNITNINIVFNELLFKYWNETVIKYTNIKNKNDLDGNPNITISLPVLDMLVNFNDKVKINLDKNILDNLLSFTNDFLYGLSMYQIYTKYCNDLFNNKLVNLFDLFGLKNHIKALKNIETEEEKKEKDFNDKRMSFDQKEIKEIQRQMNKKKPNMSIGGKISSLVININKNKSFDAKEGNLMKIKMMNIGVSLEMFNTDEDVNINNSISSNKEQDSKKSIHIEKERKKEKEEPIYNTISLSINNILFLIKEQPIPKDSKPNYFILLSKNKSPNIDSIDYFFLSFKFRNLKKIREDITILEVDEDVSDDSNEKDLEKKTSKESNNSKSKNSDKFKANNVKITLDPKTTDYIAFLLNNQVKLDNMEMVVDIKISETIINSFYHKLNSLSTSLSDLFTDFTNNTNKENEGPFSNPGERIPLCEDRIMFFKCDFIMNHLLVDLFLKEEKEHKNWMRLLLLIDNFRFIFNEIGISLSLSKNYIYILKDFSYIYHLKNINKENMFDIDDKINDIHKEDSYMKRLGYVELFYNDKIEFMKTEKEMKVDLGNINLFLCKDSYDFLIDFFQKFNNNYLGKIKEIFSRDLSNSEDSEEEIEKEEKIEEKPKIINEENNQNEKIKKEKDKKDEFSDFEIVDDVFFVDDSKISKEEKSNKVNKKYENLYLKKHPNKLETIPEYGKNKYKRKKTDEEIADDFAIIETKSSLKRKINREKKEEDCITYLLKLGSLRLYLFQGSDFDFEENPKKDLDLEDSSSNLEINNNENNEFIFPDNSSLNGLHIDNNYLFKIDKIKKKIIKPKRKKNDIRDYSNYILLNLIDLSFKIVDFSYFDFSIGNFFIDDNFEKSQYKKIISKKDFLSDNSKFLMCRLELLKNDIKNKEKEKENSNKNKDITFMRIDLSIPSLDIFVDQLPLNFIIKLLLSMNFESNETNNKNSSSSKSGDNEINIDNNSNKDNYEKNLGKNKITENTNENNNNKLNLLKSFNDWDEALEESENKNEKDENEEDSSNILINEILINTFTINFHYNSHKIKISKVYAKGDWIEFLSGLSDIKELNLKFKLYRKSNPSTIPDTLNDLINFWKDDILSNQVANSALRGLSVTRPFFKLYDGVKDLVKQPYLAYKKNEGIKRGFKRGMKNFLVSFSSQGIFFGEKIFRGMKIVVFRKTKLSLKKKSLYKAWVYKINQKQHDYEMYYYKQK